MESASLDEILLLNQGEALPYITARLNNESTISYQKVINNLKSISMVPHYIKETFKSGFKKFNEYWSNLSQTQRKTYIALIPTTILGSRLAGGGINGLIREYPNSAQETALGAYFLLLVIGLGVYFHYERR